MKSCCGFNLKNLNENFETTITNSENGIRIDVSPKDKSKVEALQKLAEACQELCDENCC